VFTAFRENLSHSYEASPVITQCYLPPDTGKITYLYPANKPVLDLRIQGMKSWVKLCGWSFTEMVYLSADSHPSTLQLQLTAIWP